MKRMIIVAVVGLSVLAIGLLGVTAFAYNLGQQPSQQTGLCSSTSVSGFGRGIMGGGRTGGMMSKEYSPYSDYSASSGYSHQYASGVNGMEEHGLMGWP